MAKRHTGLCAKCQNPDIELPEDQYFCEACDKELADAGVTADSIFRQVMIDSEREERLHARREWDHRELKLSNAEMDELLLASDDLRPTENPTPGVGTLEHFMLMSKRFRDRWYEFGLKGVKGFDLHDFQNAQEAVALMLSHMAAYKMAYGQISRADKGASLDVFNDMRGKRGLMPIKRSRFAEHKHEAKSKLRYFEKNGKIRSQWLSPKGKD